MIATPRTLGPYQLLSELGRGSMGVVWKASDSRDGRIVALKVLSSGLLPGEGARRFRREFRAASRLDHAHIVKVFEFHSEPVLFFTMEFVPGRTLRELLDAEGRSEGLQQNSAAWVAQRLRLLREAAMALEHMHGHGILHRDLKPTNLLLGADGAVKVADFGLARLDGPAGSRSRAGQVIGSLAYMSPEQVRGGGIDRRTDLYGLGAVFYECLAGQPPFPESDLSALLLRQLYDNPGSPRLGNPGLDPLLESLALRCLAKDPLHRPQSAAELMVELQGIAERLGVVLPAPERAAGRAASVLELGTFSPQLIGRDAERAQLRAALGRSRSEGGALVLLTGQTAIGRSRLGEDLQAEARLQGFRYILSRGPAEARPLGAFATALLEAARATREGRGEASGALTADVAVLARFLPGLPGRSPEHVERDTPVDRLRAVWAAENLIRHHAEAGPLAIFLDDFQDADPLSLDLLERLSADLGQPGARAHPFFLAVALRSEAVAARPALAAALDELRRRPAVAELALLPLDEEHSGKLVQSLLGTARVPRRLRSLVHEATGGVPGDIVELVKALVARRLVREEAGSLALDLPAGSPSSSLLAPLAAARARLEALPGGDRRLLEAVSLLGPNVRVEILGSALGLADEELLDVLDRLIAERILVDVPGADAVAFQHQRMREAALASLSPEALTALRRTLAAHIERNGTLPDSLHRVAELYRAAGDIDAALRVMPLSAEAYARSGLLSEALACYEDLSAWIDRSGRNGEPMVLKRRAELLAQTGRTAESVEAFRKLAREARRCGDEGLASEALRLAARSLEMLGQYNESLDLLTAAREAAEAAGDRARLAAAMGAAGHVEINRGRYDRALEILSEGLSAARESGDAMLEATLLQRVGLAEWYRARFVEALAAFEQALGLQQASGDRWNAASSLVNIGNIQFARGDTSAAREAYQRALAMKRDLGDLAGAAGALRALGQVAVELGESDEAAAAFAECLAIRRRFRDVRGEAIVLVNQADLGIWCGRAAEAEALARAALERFRGIGDRNGEANALLSLAAAAWERRDDAVTATHAEAARSLALALALADERLRAECLLGRVERALGNPRAALERLLAAEHTAQGSATALLALEARAERLLSRAESEGGETCAREAEALLADTRASPLPLRIRCLLAGAIAFAAAAESTAAEEAEVEARALLEEAALRRPEAERATFLSRRDFAARVTGHPAAPGRRAAGDAGRSAPPVGEYERLRFFHRIVLASDLGDPDSLLASFIDAALEQLHYARGFVLVPRERELVCRAARTRAGRDIREPEAEVPARILERVVAAREALFAVDTASASGVGFEGSVALHDVRSFAAVPLVRGESQLAALYLDRPEVGPAPERSSLQLVTEVFGDLGGLIERAARVREREARAEELSAQSRGESGSIIGRSAAILKVVRLAVAVAPSEATVLIDGEDGTGKELVAREVHARSRRAGKALVVVNCGALAESLLESELFGHVRGAFTGAVRDRMGVFEAASGGTLFLDEIGEMSAALQVRLLRALENGEITRVGTSETRRVDVRVVAATNRDLAEDVKNGRFRKDLYYRLRVVAIRMPALRERKGDVPLLAHHFLGRYAARAGATIAGFTHEAMRALTRYAWPGNVRELENVIERAVVLSAGAAEIGLELLPDELLESGPPGDGPGGGALRETLEALERRLIEKALQDAQGNRTRAAEALGMSVRNLQKKLARHDLR